MRRPPYRNADAAAGRATLGAFLRWRLSERPRALSALRARGEAPTPRVENDGAPLRSEAAGANVTWVGHATVILRLGGLTYYTDPVWSDRIPGFLSRRVAPSPALEAAPPPDVILQSHNHYDHLDAPTVRRLSQRATVVTGLGVGRFYRARGFGDVRELDWWESTRVQDARVTYVPAQHFSRRGLLDENRTLWGGFVIEPPRGPVVYFAGDSGYFRGFREIGKRFPTIDLACLPIGAYEPRAFMKPMHMNPEDAGQAFLDLGARRFLPIHWGTFRLTDEPMDEPPLRLARWWEAQKLPRADLLLPAVGETLPLLR